MQPRLQSYSVIALHSVGLALSAGCGERLAAPIGASAIVAPIGGGTSDGTRALVHHGRIVSFALSRDGTMLATGSEDEENSVVLWDMRSGAVLRSIDVDGGVGIADCLSRGIAFSADGRLVGFNANTSSVYVAEVATGRIVLEASTDNGDSAPSWAFSDDGSEVFVSGASEECADAMGVLFAVAAPHAPRCVGGRAGESTVSAVAVRDGRAHAVSVRSLLSREIEGTGLVATNLTGAPFLDGTPSPTHRRVAIGHPSPNNDTIALYEVDTHRRIYQGVVPNLTGFAFASANESRWAVVRAEPRADTGVVLLNDGAETGRIAGPLETRELQFADGLPFAFSPDGTQTIVLRPGGRIERGTGAALARVVGAHGLAWPIPEVILALGADVVAFVDAGSGAVVRVHRR